MKIKTQKPTDSDVSLKYNCPNCHSEHWLFLREAQAKKYRVVCDCRTVFKPKRISKIKIIYASMHKPHQAKEESTVSVDILNQSVKILQDHGFSKKESEDLIGRAYDKVNSTDVVLLVKTAIKIFGESNEE